MRWDSKEKTPNCSTADSELRTKMAAISDRSLPVVAKAYEDEEWVTTYDGGVDGQWAWGHDDWDEALATPTDVEECIISYWAELMHPRERLAFIRSKFGGALKTQAMKNIWHWLKGADANVERSYKNTSGAPTIEDIATQINEMLCCWAHSGERGTRHSAKAGPRTG